MIKNILNQPLALPCGSEIPNRICKAAMTEGLADKYNMPTPELNSLYKTWSKGGAGLLITGNVQVDRRYMERAGNVAIDGKQGQTQFEKLKEWAKSASINGNHCWVQLGHAGRQTDARVNKIGIAPSAIKSKNIAGQILMPSFTPKEISKKEIASICDKFAYAAEVCKHSGFSGIQIHSAHGYLLSSFLNPIANQRNDEYNGSIENRAKFLIQVIRHTRAAVGSNFPISVKINSSDFLKGGLSPKDSAKIALLLDKEKIDLLELSGGSYENLAIFRGKDAFSSDNVKEAYFLDSSKNIFDAVKRTPIMLTGGIRSRSVMEKIILQKKIDIIGIARPLCGMPNGVNLLLNNKIDILPKYEDQIDYPFLLKWLKLFSFGRVMGKAAIILWCYQNEIDLSKEKASDIEGREMNILKSIISMNRYERKKALSLQGINCNGLIYNKN